MSVKREDLLAAATAGVLHYGEVDRLLIFLARREITSQKIHGPQKKTMPRKGFHLMYYLAGILAIGIATLCGTLLSSREVGSLGLVAVVWFTLLYALCAVGATAWFDMRGGSVPIALFAVLVIALMPLAVFALQRVMEF
jgi:hypothetical protein